MVKEQFNTFEREHKTRITIVKKNLIINDLRRLVETGKIIGLTYTELSKVYNIQRQTISEYLKKIYATVPPEDITAIRVKLETTFNHLFKESQLLLAESTCPKERKEAIELLLRMIEKFTDFLERFDIKPKATVKVNVISDSLNIDEVSLAILEKYK